ncbi:Plant methyltransferase dimerization [Penicillium herquei]|nr:Plant methyltransferase dimerization [Penicillium herquei]
MDIKQIKDLLAETSALIDEIESTNGDGLRVEAQEKATQLARALEIPRIAILKLAFSPVTFMAVMAAHHMGIFSVLGDTDSPVPLATLAAPKAADPLLVERILRVLIASGFAEEPSPGEYLPTALSKEMTLRPSIGIVDSLRIYLAFSKPETLTRFNSFMEEHLGNRPDWGDWFPVQEQLLDHVYLKPDAPFLVDIEDVPHVLEEIRGVQDLEKAGIETVPYNFFTNVQPIQGARVYFFKHVLHDWSDEKAAIIFNNLKPAMKRGFSKIIMEDYIFPDRNAHSISCLTDLAVMVWFSGMERTRQRWIDLLESVGLRILKFWVREGDDLGIIEADVAED